MNNAVKCVLSAVGGFAFGAVGAYIFLKKKFEGQYYADLSAAIDEECENLRRMHSELQPFGSTKDVVRETTVEEPEKAKEKINTRMVDYTTYFAGTPMASVPDDDEDEEDPAESEYPVEEDPPSLYEDKDSEFMIEQDFICLPDIFTIVEWGLCVKDGTLVDENDEMVENPYKYVGTLLDDIPLALHNGDIVGDTAYILCHRDGMGIQVHLYDCTYADLVGDPL